MRSLSATVETYRWKILLQLDGDLHDKPTAEFGAGIGRLSLE